MASQFTYSILQYRHSLILNESVNVGIVFYFSDTNKSYFVAGDIQRVKCLYPGFDPAIFNAIIKDINKRLDAPQTGLFINETFAEYLDSLLLPDSSALQFTEPFTATEVFEDPQKTVDEFERLLLPSNQVLKEKYYPQDEKQILKKLVDSITKKDIKIEHRMHRNKVIQTKGVKITFELAWKNGVTHLIKPISFDLNLERDIQDKSVRYFGYLGLLSDYARLNEYTFDLLIGKPTNPQLYKSYENALEVLSESIAPKELITEEKLESYSEETAEILRHKGLEDEPEAEFPF